MSEHTIQQLRKEVGMLQQSCDEHIRIRNEMGDRIADQERELQARREILDTIMASCGDTGKSWLACADWRQRARDFANDREQHQFRKSAWTLNRGHGITLYAKNGFFVAYYDDAAEVWKHADDDKPMYHVMSDSDRPHRAVIHPLFLVPWLEHFTEIFLPVEVCGWGVLVDE